jgi:glyoxylase-like metal-dependent hydrolase (beta-lactamase superfamily II)
MEIAEGVYSVGQRQGGQVRCFLLDDGRSLTLVDTLWDADAGRVLAEIGRIGRKVTDLKHIVLTHAHRSHLGGLATLRQMSGAVVCSHGWEQDIVEGDRVAQAVPLLPQRPVLAYAPVYPLQLGAALGLGSHPPCRVNVPIGDGDRVGPLQVIHAPGHTPGHLAFYWPQRKALFAGDAVVTYPIFAAGWPAFVLNRRQAYASLCRMSDRPLDVVAVGHGDALSADVAQRLQALIDDAYQQWNRAVANLRPVDPVREPPDPE